MQYEKKEQIENLFKNNPGIIEEFEKVDSKDAVVALFARHGIEMSDEDLFCFTKDNDLLPEDVKLPEGEIGDEELENVSGGFGLTLIACLGAAWLGAQAGVKLRRAYDKAVYGDPYRSYPKTRWS